MITVTIPAVDLFDEATELFVTSKGTTLQLEHSLVSLSKWEMKWLKPFLSKEAKTTEETIDYIKCMTITQNVDDKVYGSIPQNVMDDITSYIDSPMTATTFSKSNKHNINRDVITSEIIYYWMVTFNIPFECQKWHLNRLLTLINVCNVKQQPPKKMSKSELYARNRTLNESRKNALNTTG